MEVGECRTNQKIADFGMFSMLAKQAFHKREILQSRECAVPFIEKKLFHNCHTVNLCANFCIRIMRVTGNLNSYRFYQSCIYVLSGFLNLMMLRKADFTLQRQKHVTGSDDLMITLCALPVIAPR